MISIEEYKFYSDIAIRIFNYMNGKINTLNRNCKLSIHYNGINGAIGLTNYPDHIEIYIGSIMLNWRDEWSSLFDRHDYICTCIAWTLSHELYHTDQLIYMHQYNNNTEYRQSIEGDVERMSYDWVVKHAPQLSKIGGFNVVIEYLSSETLPDVGHYNKASIKEYYLQTILNVIIRDPYVFNIFDVFKNDKLSNTIILEFGGQDRVTIKSNKRYLKENIDLFNAITYKWVGTHDDYYVTISSSYIDDDNMVVLVGFEFKNLCITPFESSDIFPFEVCS